MLTLSLVAQSSFLKGKGGINQRNWHNSIQRQCFLYVLAVIVVAVCFCFSFWPHLEVLRVIPGSSLRDQLLAVFRGPYKCSALNLGQLQARQKPCLLCTLPNPPTVSYLSQISDKQSNPEWVKHLNSFLGFMNIYLFRVLLMQIKHYEYIHLSTLSFVIKTTAKLQVLLMIAFVHLYRSEMLLQLTEITWVCCPHAKGIGERSPRSQ